MNEWRLKKKMLLGRSNRQMRTDGNTSGDVRGGEGTFIAAAAVVSTK